MWSAGSEPAQVYLGITTLGVWVPGTQRTEVRWESTTSAQDGWIRALDMLSESGTKATRRRVALWMSGSLARPFMFEPVQGLRRAFDANRIAAELAPEATGLQGPCDVWMDDWTPQRSSLAIALDRQVRGHIEHAATERKVALRSMQPWWVGALNDALQDPPADLRLLAVEEPDALTLLSGSDGTFERLATYAPGPDTGQGSALLTRALLAASAGPAQGLLASLSTDLVPAAGVGLEGKARPFAARLDRLK